MTLSFSILQFPAEKFFVIDRISRCMVFNTDTYFILMMQKKIMALRKLITIRANWFYGMEI